MRIYSISPPSVWLLLSSTLLRLSRNTNQAHRLVRHNHLQEDTSIRKPNCELGKRRTTVKFNPDPGTKYGGIPILDSAMWEGVFFS